MAKGIVKHKLGERVSVVSHQLKTPLSVIKGYLEVLLSDDLGEVNEKQKEYLMDALENTEYMIGLVRGLLDVAQIEADQVNLKPKTTDLSEIVEEVIKEFSYIAGARNCTIFFEPEDNIPQVEVDPIKIKQVIANLVSNAINYNKRKGRVDISLSVKGKEVLFCCRDTGIGIREEDKGKVFTKFYRGDEAITLTSTGSGLGLFISKAIIERSGGRMWFRSEKGEGSEFCFSLPIKNKKT